MLNMRMWRRGYVSVVRITVAMALIFAAAVCRAQEADQGLPDEPVSRESMAPEEYRAFKAPLDVAVSRQALTPPAPRHSFVSGTNRHHLNLQTMHSGFEPMCFRPKFRAKGNDMDRVVLGPEFARTLAEGFYDGARVRVYHPINGRLVKIRDCVVPEGGHHATGWMPYRGWYTVTTQGNTEFVGAMDSSFRPDRDYWFMVKAVDRFRQWSEPSNVLKVHVDRAEGQEVPQKPRNYGKYRWNAVEKPAPPAAPRNLKVRREEDRLIFSWDPVEGEDVAGYGLFVSAVAPERQKGFGLQLAARDPRPDQIIQENDIVFVDQTKTRLNYSDLSPYAGWPAWRWKVKHPFAQWGAADAWSDGRNFPATWEFVEHPGRLPEEFVNRGKTCLKWQVEGTDLTGIYLYPYGPKGDGWYPTLHPKEYRIEAWVRGEGKARIMFTGPFADTEAQLPYDQRPGDDPDMAIELIELPLTDSWQHATATFRPPAYAEKGLGCIMLVVEGPTTLYIDDLKICEADHPAGDFHPLTLQRIRESDMRFMRTHELIKTTWGYTVDGMTGPAGHNNYSGSRARKHTFFSLLDQMKQAGNIRPWLQVEMCLSEEEWQAFAEWMCAPYDPAAGDTPRKKPYAYRRRAMGQEKPWIEEFDEWAFEVANETWNQTFAPYDWDWGMTLRDGATGQEYSYGATYGLFYEYVIEQLRKSPYWTDEVEAKTRYMLCGWQAAQLFGADAKRHSPSADAITYAAYCSNSGLGDPKVINDFKRFYWMQWGQSAVAGQVKSSVETEAVLEGEGLQVESGTYEYGPGYHVMPGDPRETKEVDQQMARSMIAAVFVLDACLTRAEAGFTDQAFFTFGHRIGAWGSHTAIEYGGYAYPFWKALMLYNRHGTGRFLEVELRSAPTWDFPSYKAEDNMHVARRDAMPGAPLMSVYASAEGDRVTVFRISRKLDDFPVTGDDGYTPATLRLPFKSAKKITLHKLTGDPRVEDRFEEHTEIESVSIPTGAFDGSLTVNQDTGGDRRGLPPASVFCYVFEGTDIGEVNTRPTARFDLPREILAGQPVTIENHSADADGDPLAFNWTLGAAGRSNDQRPTFRPPSAGFHRIALEVTDPSGASDRMVRDQRVAVEFGGTTWRPLATIPRVCNPPRAIVEGRTLKVTGAAALGHGSGSYPVLATESRYREDFTFEATVEGVDAPANARQKLGGLVLVSRDRAGLGFGLNDGKRLHTHAAVLVEPDGAVSTVRGNRVEQVLPAGSVSFPVRLRIAVRDGRATASVRAGRGWKKVAGFDGLDHVGLMPAVTAGSGNKNTETTVTLSEIALSR